MAFNIFSINILILRYLIVYGLVKLCYTSFSPHWFWTRSLYPHSLPIVIIVIISTLMLKRHVWLKTWCFLLTIWYLVSEIYDLISIMHVRRDISFRIWQWQKLYFYLKDIVDTIIKFLIFLIASYIWWDYL